MQDYIGQCEEIMQKNVACWVFCVLFSSINSKWGVVCQFSLRAPLWLVQMQYVVPITLKVGQKYALNDFAMNTCTLRTKSWLPGFYKAALLAKIDTTVFSSCNTFACSPSTTPQAGSQMSIECRLTSLARDFGAHLAAALIP